MRNLTGVFDHSLQRNSRQQAAPRAESIPPRQLRSVRYMRIPTRCLRLGFCFVLNVKKYGYEFRKLAFHLLSTKTGVLINTLPDQAVSLLGESSSYRAPLSISILWRAPDGVTSVA